MSDNEYDVADDSEYSYCSDRETDNTSDDNALSLDWQTLSSQSEIILFDQELDDESIDKLCDILKDNNTVVHTLNLGNCSLSCSQIERIAIALTTNKSLRIIDLWGNSVADKGAVALIQTLSINILIQAINVNEECYISPQNLSLIAKLLERNQTIKKLFTYLNTLTHITQYDNKQLSKDIQHLKTYNDIYNLTVLKEMHALLLLLQKIQPGDVKKILNSSKIDCKTPELQRFGQELTVLQKTAQKIENIQKHLYVLTNAGQYDNNDLSPHIKELHEICPEINNKHEWSLLPAILKAAYILLYALQCFKSSDFMRPNDLTHMLENLERKRVIFDLQIIAKTHLSDIFSLLHSLYKMKAIQKRLHLLATRDDYSNHDLSQDMIALENDYPNIKEPTSLLKPPTALKEIYFLLCTLQQIKSHTAGETLKHWEMLFETQTIQILAEKLLPEIIPVQSVLQNIREIHLSLCIRVDDDNTICKHIEDLENNLSHFSRNTPSSEVIGLAFILLDRLQHPDSKQQLTLPASPSYFKKIAEDITTSFQIKSILQYLNNLNDIVEYNDEQLDKDIAQFENNYTPIFLGSKESRTVLQETYHLLSILQQLKCNQKMDNAVNHLNIITTPSLNKPLSSLLSNISLADHVFTMMKSIEVSLDFFVLDHDGSDVYLSTLMNDLDTMSPQISHKLNSANIHPSLKIIVFLKHALMLFSPIELSKSALDQQLHNLATTLALSYDEGILKTILSLLFKLQDRKDIQKRLTTLQYIDAYDESVLSQDISKLENIYSELKSRSFDPPLAFKETYLLLRILRQFKSINVNEAPEIKPELSFRMPKLQKFTHDHHFCHLMPLLRKTIEINKYINIDQKIFSVDTLFEHIRSLEELLLKLKNSEFDVLPNTFLKETHFLRALKQIDRQYWNSRNRSYMLINLRQKFIQDPQTYDDDLMSVAEKGALDNIKSYWNSLEHIEQYHDSKLREHIDNLENICTALKNPSDWYMLPDRLIAPYLLLKAVRQYQSGQTLEALACLQKNLDRFEDSYDKNIVHQLIAKIDTMITVYNTQNTIQTHLSSLIECGDDYNLNILSSYIDTVNKACPYITNKREWSRLPTSFQAHYILLYMLQHFRCNQVVHNDFNQLLTHLETTFKIYNLHEFSNNEQLSNIFSLLYIKHKMKNIQDRLSRIETLEQYRKEDLSQDKMDLEKHYPQLTDSNLELKLPTALKEMWFLLQALQQFQTLDTDEILQYWEMIFDTQSLRLLAEKLLPQIVPLQSVLQRIREINLSLNTLRSLSQNSTYIFVVNGESNKLSKHNQLSKHIDDLAEELSHFPRDTTPLRSIHIAFKLLDKLQNPDSKQLLTLSAIPSYFERIAQDIALSLQITSITRYLNKLKDIIEYDDEQLESDIVRLDNDYTAISSDLNKLCIETGSLLKILRQFKSAQKIEESAIEYWRQSTIEGLKNSISSLLSNIEVLSTMNSVQKGLAFFVRENEDINGLQSNVYLSNIMLHLEDKYPRLNDEIPPLKKITVLKSMLALFYPLDMPKSGLDQQLRTLAITLNISWHQEPFKTLLSLLCTLQDRKRIQMLLSALKYLDEYDENVLSQDIGNLEDIRPELKDFRRLLSNALEETYFLLRVLRQLKSIDVSEDLDIQPTLLFETRDLQKFAQDHRFDFLIPVLLKTIEIKKYLNISPRLISLDTLFKHIDNLNELLLTNNNPASSCLPNTLLNETRVLGANWRSVFNAIEKMAQYGETLNAKQQPKGATAIALANELQAKALEFIKTGKASELTQFKREFSALLNSKNKEMGDYRINWDTIIKNILIALTGIGVVLIAAKLCYSYATQNRPLFFFQKEATTSEGLVRDIQMTLEDKGEEKINFGA